MKKHLSKDPRVKMKTFSWPEYVVSSVTFAILGAIPAMIYTNGTMSSLFSSEYTFAYFLYWCIVAAIVCALITLQKYHRFDRPLRKLCDATRKVAEGDFSIRIQPDHTEENADYLDVMFTDFNKMVAELGSIETLKNDFVSNVSHEIKTPLAIIKSYVSALQNPELPEETRQQYMETIVSATDRLSNLVTNILKLNKLENQMIVAQPKAYNICRQLGECILGFEELWEKKQIEPVVEIEDGTQLVADPGMMEIVWNNLLSNAIKFTPVGGQVHLRQTSDDAYITVQVQDNGCGMSEETMRRIFDKFYQGDTAHSGEGNGLGLALAQKIVDIAGGVMSVESRQGVGSTFTVRLNVANRIS